MRFSFFIGFYRNFQLFLKLGLYIFPKDKSVSGIYNSQRCKIPTIVSLVLSNPRQTVSSWLTQTQMLLMDTLRNQTDCEHTSWQIMYCMWGNRAYLPWGNFWWLTELVHSGTTKSKWYSYSLYTPPQWVWNKTINM